MLAVPPLKTLKEMLAVPPTVVVPEVPMLGPEKVSPYAENAPIIRRIATVRLKADETLTFILLTLTATRF